MYTIIDFGSREKVSFTIWRIGVSAGGVLGLPTVFEC